MNGPAIVSGASVIPQDGSTSGLNAGGANDAGTLPPTGAPNPSPPPSLPNTNDFGRIGRINRIGRVNRFE